MKIIFTIMQITVFLMIMIGCDLQSPELKAENDEKNYSHSDLLPARNSTAYPYYVSADDQGNLYFRVENRGKGTAKSSTTRIIFYMSGTDYNVYLPTLELAPGQSQTLGPVQAPLGWYNPDGNFKIMADYKDDVKEANETNNNADGTIIG